MTRYKNIKNIKNIKNEIYSATINKEIEILYINFFKANL
jgi:hypothetical protein